MSTEEKLKNYIVMKYGSVRKFAPLTGLPYSTIASILRRGVKNCNLQNLQAICDALNISSIALLDGIIEEKPKEQDDKIFVERSDVGAFVDYFIKDLNAVIELKPQKEITFDGISLIKNDAAFIKNYLNMMLFMLREERKNHKEDPEE